jgi:hypothetical protein
MPFIPLGEPALPKASSDLGRGGYTPVVFPKSAQVVWGEWVANLLILGVRRSFGMRGIGGGSSCDCGGRSNLRLLNIGNGNTNSIGCQVVKMEKGKWKRESGRGSWMVAGSNGLRSVWGGGRQTRLWKLRVTWAGDLKCEKWVRGQKEGPGRVTTKPAPFQKTKGCGTQRPFRADNCGWMGLL